MATKNPVRLKDIAERCGVSVVTVSRALRGDRSFVSATMADKIHAIARELHYDPSRTIAARRLVQSNSDKRVINNAVALLGPPIAADSRYTNRLYEGICQVLVEQGCALVLAFSYGPTLHENASHLLPILLRGEVDGAITYIGKPNIAPILTRMREELGFGDRPVVSLFESLPGCLSVCADDYGGGYALGAHLLDLGHRHILHTYTLEYATCPTAPRLAGLRQACHDRGLAPEDVLREVAVTEYISPDIWLPSILSTLRAHSEITAIVARNDSTAAAIGAYLQAAGLAIPDDVSLVGFDDIYTHIAENPPIPLTTVAVPLEEIGRTAARLLLHAVAGESVPDTPVVLPAPLVARQSSSPPRGV